MPANDTEIEKRLWHAADELRAADYSRPVPGPIFLRCAGHHLGHAHQQILAERAVATHRLLPFSDADYHARGVLFVPPEARFDHLLHLPEGVLPKSYHHHGNDTLASVSVSPAPGASTCAA